MRILRMSIVPLLVIVTALPSFAAAEQRHAVAPAALAAAVANHAAKQDADRESIHQALSRPEVIEVAARTGVDLARLNAATQTLSGADLERAAAATSAMRHSRLRPGLPSPARTPAPPGRLRHSRRP